MQQFFEIRLGSMTMAEYEKKFLGLLKYVRFIGDEKVKMQVDCQPFISKISSIINPRP
jgi:hypothetical protein